MCFIRMTGMKIICKTKQKNRPVFSSIYPLGLKKEMATFMAK